MTISVIIPTYNRCGYLQQAVTSVLQQSLAPDSYEIIIVDNGSTDETKAVAEEITGEYGRRVAYIYESAPGLHNARHRGAREARGDILVFVDDDIIAAPQWLGAIHEAFKDRDTVLVGGKILPKWEGEAPEWLEIFKDEDAYGWRIGHLSLLDLGDHRRRIPATCVYGCNFSVRKTVLYRCGGFHPDSMPGQLMKYRGDGETALSRAIEREEYKVVYEPEATVYHCVPANRLTVEYFCQRAFKQGISDSFAEIRNSHGMNGRPMADRRVRKASLSAFLKLLRSYGERKIDPKHRAIRDLVAKEHEKGKEFLLRHTKEEPELLAHVLKENYF
jgi:glycosyltransferase involved in cell wall biosynthesis